MNTIIKVCVTDVELYGVLDGKKMKTVEQFTQIYRDRLSKFKALFKEEVLSIAKVLQIRKRRENVLFVGLVREIRETKNKYRILTLEDESGECEVLINKYDSSIIFPDQPIGIRGDVGDAFIYNKEIVYPPFSEREFTLGKGKVAFVSDVHVGSAKFKEENFKKMLSFLKEEGVETLFVVGDLVDGVGIYPNQDEDQRLKDIQNQYDSFCSLIPDWLTVYACPGNHDAVRLAEPQPPLTKYIKKDNIKLVENPSVISVNGVKILLYHGYSFDFYLGGWKETGGYDNPQVLMKMLLERRHLAPSAQSVPRMSGTDNLFIGDDTIDIFATGHVHKCKVTHYKGVTLMSCGCWQDKTDFQEKVGHNPDPCKVPIVDLETRNVRVIDFS